MHIIVERIDIFNKVKDNNNKGQHISREVEPDLNFVEH